MITSEKSLPESGKNFEMASGLLNFRGACPQTPLATRACCARLACLSPHKFLATAMLNVCNLCQAAYNTSCVDASDMLCSDDRKSEHDAISVVRVFQLAL